MTPEQEKVLVETVEKLTISLQIVATRLEKLWETYTQEPEMAAARKSMIEANFVLCEAFPWLREEPTTKSARSG